jgi:hypothetical protein
MDATLSNIMPILDMLCKMVLFSKMTDEGNQSIPFRKRDAFKYTFKWAVKPLKVFWKKYTSIDLTAVLQN